jgi:hypothetical protein
MPYEVSLDALPAGRALHRARPGESLAVQTTGFLTPEDGNDLITLLEAISNCFPSIVGVKGKFFESQVDNLLAIVRPDKTATVYCNEIQLIAEVRAKRRIFPGEEVFKGDIADIGRLQLKDKTGSDIELPSDAGIQLLFTAGWRRGLCSGPRFSDHGDGWTGGY